MLNNSPLLQQPCRGLSPRLLMTLAGALCTIIIIYYTLNNYSLASHDNNIAWGRVNLIFEGKKCLAIFVRLAH